MNSFTLFTERLDRKIKFGNKNTGYKSAADL